MKKVFVDTNILLDVLLERHPFCEPAQTLWTMVEQKKLAGAVSAISFNNIFYLIRKFSTAEKAYQALNTLSDIFKIVEVNQRIIKETLKTQWPDFEDGIQHACALKFGAKVILSRDTKGFGSGKVPVMGCSEYLEKFKV